MAWGNYLKCFYFLWLILEIMETLKDVENGPQAVGSLVNLMNR